MASASVAAARLQDLLRSFVSHNHDHGVKKLVPDSYAVVSSSSSSPSYTVVLDAAEMLEYLPFYAALLQPLSHGTSGNTAITSAVITGASYTVSHADRGQRAIFASLLQFVGSVVEKHLRTFMQDVWTGPQFVRLTDNSSQIYSCCGSGETSASEEECMEEQAKSAESSAVTTTTLASCDGGHRVNFIAWVALEVYRRLSAEAETAAHERRVRGGSASAAALDAGVCTDAYREWEQKLRERFNASLHAARATEARDTRGSSSSDDAHTEMHSDKKNAAAAATTSAPLSFEAYYDEDDIFTNKPHFFSSFLRKHLLPFLQIHVRGKVAIQEDELSPVEELRRWIRSYPVTASVTPVANNHSGSVEAARAVNPRETKEEEEEQKFQVDNASALLKDEHWKSLVRLILGRSITSTLKGEDVYEQSGLLRPHTPAQQAAYVAAAAVLALMPAVVGPATRWLDRILCLKGSSCSKENNPSVDDIAAQRYTQGNVEGREKECLEAMWRALDMCTRSLQIVPFPLCDGHDAEVRCDAQLAGEWLVPSPNGASSKVPQVYRQDIYRRGVESQHRTVLLPGLSIAATRIRSLAADLSTSTSTNLSVARRASRNRSGGAVAPETATPPGTCIVSPASALVQLLLLDEGQLGAAPCRNAPNAPPSPSFCLREVDAPSLRCVEWLLLFTELPETTAKLEEIRAALDTGISSGWVVLVVQASVAKSTQAWVEDAWGSAARPVLLLSAVGRWGLQQLSLRFEVEANTTFTEPRALRGVRRGGGGQPYCGVAVLLLHAHTCEPSMMLSGGDAQSAAGHTAPQRGVRRRRQHTAYSELREHLLIVVGAVEETKSADLAGDGGESPRHLNNFSGVKVSSPHTAPSTQPPAMSMYCADSSSTSSSFFSSGEDDAESDRTTGNCYRSSSGFSTGFTDSTTPSSQELATGRMARWYGKNCELPPFPFVTCSVLLGAAPFTATRSGQRELLYHFWCWWRLLLHRLVLPPELGCAVTAHGARSANVAALRCLDDLICRDEQLGAIGGAAETGRALGIEDSVSPRQCHLLRVLREALWSYELLAVQEDGEGKRLDEAWAMLQRWVATAEDAAAAPAGAANPPLGGASLATTAAMTTCEAACGALCNESVELTAASSFASVESWLQVQSAYVALCSCMDELCRTVVLVGGEAGEKEEDTSNSSFSDLFFLPMI